MLTEVGLRHSHFSDVTELLLGLQGLLIEGQRFLGLAELAEHIGHRSLRHSHASDVVRSLIYFEGLLI